MRPVILRSRRWLATASFSLSNCTGVRATVMVFCPTLRVHWYPAPPPVRAVRSWTEPRLI